MTSSSANARPSLAGQASFYFNDPFGNHLELVAVGFVDSALSVGVPDRSQLDCPAVATSPTRRLSGIACRSGHGPGALPGVVQDG